MTTTNGGITDPFSLLTQAIRKVPETRYALAVGGIIAVVAIVVGFKVNLWVAVFGAVVMLVLMTVFVIFAGLAKETGILHGPIKVFVWFSLLLVMATTLVLFSSAFWGHPLNLARLFASDPRWTSLNTEIANLGTRSSDPDWFTAYADDYLTLGRTTLRYLHYVEENPQADTDNKLLGGLSDALDRLRIRNDATKAASFKNAKGDLNPDPSYQAVKIPSKFKTFLDGIGADKGEKGGLSSQRERHYETAIRQWAIDAGISTFDQ